MEKIDSGNHRASKRSDEAAPVSSNAAEPLHLFLSHGSPPRRRQKLVHAPHGRAPTSDERTRPRRTPLRRRGQTDHHRLHRLRSTGVGGPSLPTPSPPLPTLLLRYSLHPHHP